MGIKGIYAEIGPGKRVSLAKLAIEKFEETGRPLRIAIDISIWQFQVQSGRGGQNPALRTLYYRLIRMLSLSIHPIFVFDGPDKPPFKRGKKTGADGAMLPNFLAKQMIKLFGFPIHIAPGEAEAECALLQREGIVDAVFSEDVDTLMFGCGLTLRNWSSENRSSHVATHVDAYYAEESKAGKSGLDREGMILVALMSGGDYLPAGITKCGIKIACQAARAGFGASLCKIPRSDTQLFAIWREQLSYELRTNESGCFRSRNNALVVPDDFPDLDVLGYYTHPVVSSRKEISDLKSEIKWNDTVDIRGLRDFVADAFNWPNKIGAIKFIRGFAPALLISKLRTRTPETQTADEDIDTIAANESKLVSAICGKRIHFSTDGMTELRLIYVPIDIVGLDLSTEKEDNGDYRQHEDETESRHVRVTEESSRSMSPIKRATATWDPTAPDRTWVMESLAKVGIPLKVQDYEETLRNPIKASKAKALVKQVSAKGGMPRGALDRYVKTTKPVPVVVEAGSKSHLKGPRREAAMAPLGAPGAPVPILEPASPLLSSPHGLRPRREHFKALPLDLAVKSKTKASKALSAGSLSVTGVNPWTLSNPAQRMRATHDPSPSLSSPPTPPSGSNQLKTSASRHDAENTHQSSRPTTPPSNLPVFRRPPHPFIAPEASSPGKRRRSPQTHEISSPSSASDAANLASADRDLPLAKTDSSFSVPEVIDLSSSPPQKPDSDVPLAAEEAVPRAARSRKVFLTLRESLPGTWKEVDAEDEAPQLGRDGMSQTMRTRGRVWRISQVEVLDLTGR